MMSNPNPGFVPVGVYDSVKYHNEKLRRQVEILTAENDELKEACARLQTNQGFKKASEVSEQSQETTAKLVDKKLITDLTIDLLKLKPREVIFKLVGGFVNEIRPQR